VGGIVDPKTGEIIWEMHVPLAEQLAHYRANPPRAIRGLRANAIEVDWRFDGHGEPVNSVFELACPCGGTRFTATCGLDEDGRSCSPIAIECASCETKHDVFDEAKHGYDAELGMAGSFEPVGSDDLVSTDVDAPHEVIVRFEYCSDQLGDPGRQGEREHDLFSWFTLLARDSETKQLAFLFDAECA
jgi:hypothetical protein